MVGLRRAQMATTNSSRWTEKLDGRRSVKREETTMDRYLIETPHTDEDCRQLIEQVLAMGYLYHFDWGCESGVHCGWAILEADNEAQARLAVPPLVRSKARVIKLNKYDAEAGALLHKT
jgi:hypothetical protein